MGRTPFPTSKLALSGTLDAKPQRYANRTTEPKPSIEIGNPPKHFSKELRAIWKEIKGQLVVGVLTYSDRLMVEQLCQLVQKMRAGTMTGGEGGQFISILSRCGMTPADRSRVQLDPSVAKLAVEKSPFAAFSSPPVLLKKQA
jgi:hypothetical protein